MNGLYFFSHIGKASFRWELSSVLFALGCHGIGPHSGRSSKTYSESLRT